MTGSNPDFAALTIAEIVRETADAISVALIVPPELAQRYRFKPGQHVPVRATIGGEELRRTYSISSGPDDPHLRITIKRLTDGRFSSWAHVALKPGMTLDVMRPQGRFVLPEGDGGPRHLLGLAAGAGITPIMAMLQHALAREPATCFTLIYGNRHMDDAIFRPVLEDLKDRHLGRFSLMHVLSREESDVPLLSGHIAAEKLVALTRGFGAIADVAHTFLCGPGGMIRDLRTALFGMGLPRERVHHELFAPAAGSTPTTRPTASPELQNAAVTDASRRIEVTAVLDGMRHRLEVFEGEPVLEAAIRAGLRVPYSCKGGMCCTCRARIVEGKATMRVNYSLEAWEIARGFTLTCQAVPDAAAGRLVIDYDQM